MRIALALALMGGAAVALTPRKARNAPRHAAPARRIVIVGAGFGGLSAAGRLAGRPGIDLTVIDAQNHHLFQPLLYQVATAALSPTDIASPIRGIIPASPHVRVLMELVTGIDVPGRRVLCGSLAVPYDELVIATGSRPSYFGHGEWAENAPGLKSLEDALGLRRRILDAFEAASTADPAERDRLLTFVLIGGGPTGVEMAGSIAELARDMLSRDYHMPGARARIVIVEAGSRVLAEFAPPLSSYAGRALHDLGVEIISGTKVTAIEPGLVHLDGHTLPAGCIIWTAGTEATPVAKWLGVQPGKGGKVEVGPDLRLPGHPEITVIGDAALVTRRGKPLPGLAPVAKQQGEFVARSIRRGRRHAFRYRNYGELATIGRGKAIADFGPIKLTGFAAWATWAVAHIFFLIGFRNRVMVSAQWGFAYLANDRAARLIIDGKSPHHEGS